MQGVRKVVKSYANLSKDKDNRDAGRPSIYGTENNKPEGKAKKKSNSPSKPVKY